MATIINELKDMRHLDWTRIRHSSGTAGSFLKSYDGGGLRKTYYKLSDYDATKGVVGHECVNELIVDRLLTKFGFPHLEYTLIHALITVDGRECETYLCASEDFKEYGESKVALDDFYQLERFSGESPLDFCKRMKWQKTIYEMLYVDYLILNRDRHGANLEVLRNPRSKTLRLSPLFDHGLSFACRCQKEGEFRKFDVMADLKVQAFIGTSSVRENLSLIPLKTLRGFPRITADYRDYLMEGMEGILSPYHCKLIWRMLADRSKYIEDICNP